MRDNACFLSLDEELKKGYKLSEYNLYLDKKKGLVYNLISQSAASFSDLTLKGSEKQQLMEEGFIVESSTDELQKLKEEYEFRECLTDSFHLIIAVTLDCQFRCCYCYEEHPHLYMTAATKNALVKLVEKKALLGKNISIVWYGGEPMLDFNTIKELTAEFQEICYEHGVSYAAEMITNGYLFGDDSISLLDSLDIKGVQITLDGMKEVHERRRPLINKKPSFDRILGNIIRINNETGVSVRLRINVDHTNIDSAYELVEYCAGKKLFDIDLTLGMMKSFGCNHRGTSCNKTLFSMEEFSQEFVRFRRYIKKLGFLDAAEKMSPEYKINSCTMDAPDAYVVDPEGYVYKCISQVGQKEKSIGNAITGFNEQAHTLCNAFRMQSCAKCKYFPICKGGCLRNNAHGNKECNIWRYVTEELVLDCLE